MGSLALLARELGHTVTGVDQHVYPPMSDQLESAGITLHEGYDQQHLVGMQPDQVIIGNAMSRGNPCVEYVLEKNWSYTSGPQWLAENILRDRWVLAVAGTHGKTTTSSMLAWILEYAGFKPGFLIGGVPSNFPCSARLGESDFFVIEADEYDSAFFDKRSKFIHYCPHTAILNNLEFDHADIFANLAAIQTQFHYFVRTIPPNGKIIYPQNDEALQAVIKSGCWSEQETFALNEAISHPLLQWGIDDPAIDQSRFSVLHQGVNVGEVSWPLNGQHNMHNGLAAIAAVKHIGILPNIACEALSQFAGVKRRMELRADIQGVRVYDDFAHHPTAIAKTLDGLRANYQLAAIKGNIYVVMEPRSNTMRMGVHDAHIVDACNGADKVFWYQANEEISAQLPVEKFICLTDIHDIVDQLLRVVKSGDSIVVMSNGGFAGIHDLIIENLTLKKSNH